MPIPKSLRSLRENEMSDENIDSSGLGGPWGINLVIIASVIIAYILS